MKKQISIAVFSLTLGLLAIANLSRPAPAVATDGAGGSCFLCDDWLGVDGFDYHTDQPLFLNDRKGVKHSGTAYGDCDTHTWYSN
jgi:hypothetical protein